MKGLKKIDVSYIVTLLFLLLTSFANFLSTNNVYWFLILIFILIVAISRKTIVTKDLRFLSIFSVIYLAFVVLRYFFANDLEIDFLLSDIIFLFKYILLAFVFVVALKEQALAYIVKVTAHLTLISFFFYFFQLAGFADVMYKYSSALNLPHEIVLEGYTNFIVFSYTQGRHDFSNSGFVWEPGAFGCFLLIALLFNLFLNKFRFDKKTIILIIGILTTLSTTTYLGLLILLFFAYRVRVPKVNKWLFLTIPVVVLLFVKVPFLGDKIIGTYTDDMVDLTRLGILERYYHKQQSAVPLNRFASMSYVYNMFQEKLILGVSNKYNDLLAKKNDVDISNGLIDFVGKFGLVGLIFLLFSYLRFCYRYLLKAEFLVYCGVILLIIGFGEPILHFPFILIFLFLPLVPLEKKKKKSAEDEAAAGTRQKRRIT